MWLVLLVLQSVQVIVQFLYPIARVVDVPVLKASAVHTKQSNDVMTLKIFMNMQCLLGVRIALIVLSV